MKHNVIPNWVYDGESGDGHTIIERIAWWNAIQFNRWFKLIYLIIKNKL